MSARCTGTPISWLRLERYQLGELATDERASIAEHLAACETCAASAASIAADDAARELPPLPTRAPAPRGGVVVVLRRWAPIAGALAVAAGVLLFLRRPPPPPGDDGGERIKGSDVSFALVNDDDTSVGDAGGLYRDGDRWKALVTCPPGLRATFELVVYENGEGAFPLAPASDLACGNAIALPGAFRTTGHAPLTVCLAWSSSTKDTLDRALLRHARPERALCKTLTPAP